MLSNMKEEINDVIDTCMIQPAKNISNVIHIVSESDISFKAKTIYYIIIVLMSFPFIVVGAAATVCSISIMIIIGVVSATLLAIPILVLFNIEKHLIKMRGNR